MAGIDPARWSEISPLLDDLLDCEPQARAARLREVGERDPDLADAVAALLAHDTALERDGFLCGSVIDAPRVVSLAGQVVGAYRIVRPIGHGGMGTVWLATRDDGRYEGHAAVKFLNLALLGEGGAARFAREGRILARLAHPNIARLLDAGVAAGGQPYLIIEYVEGEPLDRYCDAHALDTTRRIHLFLQVLDAVSHAHRNLVLHRDLKPSNILVDREGRAKLLDFGIGKLLQDGDGVAAATELTQLAGRAFTPEYAAPEQVQGGDVTTATDVYALGVLLYVLLGGVHPTAQDGTTPVDRLRAVVERLPPRLSAAALRTTGDIAGRRSATPEGLAHRLRGDLENIAAKALRKSPAERYPTVDALAEDLRRYLRREPVRARADTLGYRSWKFVSRNRVPVSLAALAVAALVAGLIGTLTQAQRATAHAAVADSQRQRADREAREAAEQRDFALQQLSRVDAVNDLNSFLLSDAVPAGTPLTVGELLARAEDIVEHQRGDTDANRIAMLVAIGQQYKFLDRDDKAREVLSQAYAASRQIRDPSVRAQAGCAYAVALGAGGQTARAEAMLREALAELPDEPQYVFDRMGCYSRGAEFAAAAMNPAVAIARAEAARDLMKRLPYPSRVWESRIMVALGEAYRAAGRYDDAIGAFRHAHEDLVALGRENTENASTLYNNWALALEQSGRPLEAETLFRRAIDNSGAAGRDKDVSPMLMNNYARVLDRLGREHEAAQWVERAYAGARRAGDEIVINQALLVRMAVYRHLGRLDKVDDALSEAAPRFARMYGPTHPAMAALSGQHALLAQARGDGEAAMRHADSALAIVRANGGDARSLAEAERRRAEIALQFAGAAAAREDAAHALALLQPLSAPEQPSSIVGLADLTYGKVLRALGETQAAHDALVAAAAQLRPTLGPRQADTQSAERFAADALVRSAP